VTGRRIARVWLAALALTRLASACTGRGYYRLPQAPGADGNFSNDVPLGVFQR
jgi:hypothetical protein